MYRYREREEDDDHESLWYELAERVCHIPGETIRPGDPHRYFHHDLLGLADADLALERYRAIFRACLERDKPNLWWLLERAGRIEHEQERRAETDRQTAARSGLRAAEPPRPPELDRTRLLAMQQAAERERERAAHEAWLAFQARQGKESA